MSIRPGVVIWRVLLTLFVLFVLSMLVLGWAVSRILGSGPELSISIVNQAGLPVVITEDYSRYPVGAGQEVTVTLDASNPNGDCAEDVEVWTDAGMVFSREEICEGETWVITAADLGAPAQVPAGTYPPPEVPRTRQISMVISNASSHDLEVVHADGVVPVGVGREITAFFELDAFDPGCLWYVTVMAADPEADFRATEVETVCDGDSFVVQDDGVVRVSDPGDTLG